MVGVANAIDAVLPGMVARGGGHLVGVSSVAGYRGLPWMAVVLGVEGGAVDVPRRAAAGPEAAGVTVTTVYPGFVRTAMTEGTPFRRPMPMLEPEQAAVHLVRAVERRPRELRVPAGARHSGWACSGGMPNRLFDWMMDRAGPEALTVEF